MGFLQRGGAYRPTSPCLWTLMSESARSTNDEGHAPLSQVRAAKYDRRTEAGIRALLPWTDALPLKAANSELRE